MTRLTAGEPIEQPPHPVGRRTVLVADPAREGRLLAADVWYPAVPGDEPPSTYELLPGITFDAASARHEPAPAPGPFPLLLFSHGRTGMRFAYSLLCEGLAARGAIVVSADHPGDVLADWLLGTFVDDRTNEMNRVADAHLVLAEMLRRTDLVPVDHDRVAIIGHSYGAYTAFATAAGVRGVDPHDQVRAVVGLQPFTRTMSDAALGRVAVPALLVVGELDRTTPASSDADRPWALLRGTPTWRADLTGAGHQAASDMGLYGDLAHQVPDLPDMVRQYLELTLVDAVGGDLRPWRELLALQLDVVWAFLDITLDIDPARGGAAATRLAATQGIGLQCR
jgi:predicted dienelactone hydrolase